MARGDFKAFGASVAEHWKQLVGGSLVAIVLGVVGTMGLSIPPVITGFIAFGLVVAYAAYLAWQDEHRKVEALTTRGFRGHIFQVGIGEAKVIGSHMTGAGITVLLKITNSGPPSILEDFTATVRCKDWQRSYRPTYLPRTNHKFSSESGQAVQIDPNEMLYEKVTVAPIPEGGRVAGFLFYFLENVLCDELKDDWPLITVHFQDASGRQYHVDSATESDDEVQLRVVGVKDPFLAFPRNRDADNAGTRQTGENYNAGVWQIREELAPQLAKGIDLKNKCGRFGQAAIDHKAFSVEAHEWAEEVAKYLSANVGQMAVVKFENANYSGATSNPGIGWDNFMFISARVVGLQQVLNNLSDYVSP